MSYSPLLEESLNDMKHEDESEATTSYRTEKRSTAWQRPIQLLNIFLMFSLCVLLILNLAFGRELNGKKTEEVVFMKKYGEDHRFMSIDHEYDHLWAGYSSSRGVVKLPPDNDHDSPRYVAVGMAHQLHCLAAFRTAIQKAREGEDVGVDWTDDDHWPHCLYYMRQAILCAADDTLEKPMIKNGTLTHSITGVDDARKCGNSDRLFRLLQENAAYRDKDEGNEGSKT